MDYKEKVIALLKSQELSKEQKEKLENIFPELAESEDEKIRKWIISDLKDSIDSCAYCERTKPQALEAIAWLEKQGEPKPYASETMNEKEDFDNGFTRMMEKEQKPADKVEPKFKVGDWIVFNGLTLYIKEVVNGYYRTVSKGGITNSYDWDIDNVARLWTIQDAKEGDVLSYVTDEEDLWIMIYWSLYEPYEGHVHYHALLVNDNFGNKGTCCICIDNLKPATKEQRDQLEKAMADAGYTFDFEKKELRKIEQKPAWSEEDEKFVHGLIRGLTAKRDIHGHTTFSSDCIDITETINWLKSLKDRVQPKNTWKPSEEQIDELENEHLKSVPKY